MTPAQAWKAFKDPAVYGPLAVVAVLGTMTAAGIAVATMPTPDEAHALSQRVLSDKQRDCQLKAAPYGAQQQAACKTRTINPDTDWVTVRGTGPKAAASAPR